MRIELSIAVDYLPSWGWWEGVRELVQNARDASVQHRCTMAIGHLKDKLIVQNDGVSLAKESLLLGTSSKAGRGDMIGQFGEGMKLGLLAIVRSGGEVSIHTGDEIWTPRIERSQQYAADVLVIATRKTQPQPNIRIEIKGVSADTWATMRSRFLFVDEPASADVVRTSKGSLLLADRHRGMVFVKGIHVFTDSTYSCGYDFSGLRVDRDRKMVADYEMSGELVMLWREATRTHPALLPRMFGLLDGAAKDVAGFEHNAHYMDDDAREAVAEQYAAKYGDAIPCESLAETEELAHLGAKGVIVPKPLLALVRRVIGDPRQTLRDEAARTYSYSELTPCEENHLMESVDLIRAVGRDISLDRIDVVDFRQKNLEGRWRSDGRIQIAKRILADKYETLAVLVHEISHDAGRDGEHEHVRSIENLWRDLYKMARA